MAVANVYKTIPIEIHHLIIYFLLLDDVNIYSNWLRIFIDTNSFYKYMAVGGGLSV